MARDNYSYKKYQRELAKKKKKEEKIQRKLDKKNAQLKENSGQVLGENAATGPNTHHDPGLPTKINRP